MIEWVMGVVDRIEEEARRDLEYRELTEHQVEFVPAFDALLQSECLSFPPNASRQIRQAAAYPAAPVPTTMVSKNKFLSIVLQSSNMEAAVDIQRLSGYIRQHAAAQRPYRLGHVLRCAPSLDGQQATLNTTVILFLHLGSHIRGNNAGTHLVHRDAVLCKAVCK